MNLWLAWVVAFAATAVLTFSLNTLFADTGLSEVDIPELSWILGGGLWLVGSFGTPLVAYYRGRRWWLWLILGLFGQIPSLFAVAFAERPSPPLSPQERELLFTYWIEIQNIARFQTAEADLYNSAVLIHGNSLDNAESMQGLLKVSARLSESGRECLRRLAATSSVPELAAEDYVAWKLVYMDYSSWADAVHDAVVALSQGHTPIGARVNELFRAAEKRRQLGESVSKRLLQRAQFSPDELAGIIRG